jgi:hypothetical protein
MKKQIPLRKERTKADFRLEFFIIKNKGTKANHARNSRSKVGKERIRSSEERRAKVSLTMPLILLGLI